LRLRLEVILSMSWLRHGGADSKSSAIGLVSSPSSVVSSNKGQQTKDNRQKKPTDCSQSFRITRPSSGSIRYDSNPISVPNQGAELNERHRTCSCGEHSGSNVRAASGHELAITAQGSDANEALAALQALVEAFLKTIPL